VEANTIKKHLVIIRPVIVRGLRILLRLRWMGTGWLL